MKKYVVLVVFVTLLTSLYSNDNGNTQTLFGGSDTIRVTGYGCPEIKLGSFNNNFAVLVGGRGGVIINSTFSIGGGGYGLVTSHKIPSLQKGDTSFYLRYGYGGMFLSYINQSDNLIHFTADLLIGAGGATYTYSLKQMMNDDDDDDDYDHRNYEISPFFVMEPSLGLELNLTPWMRLEATASYRYIAGLDLSKTTNGELSGFTGGFAIKFGKF